MKTIQNFVLLILLFSAKTIFSQDVIATGTAQESITEKPSPTENPETLAPIPDEKAPEDGKLDYETDTLATLQPQEVETQGIVVNSPDNQQNKEEILTTAPEVQESATIDSEPAAEVPIETTNEEPPTLSEIEPEVPENTSEQIPSETTENVQPIESTLSPEIEKVTEDQVSGTNEIEVPLEASSGTSETETETEAAVHKPSDTKFPANTGESETEPSKTEEAVKEPVVEQVDNTSPPATTGASETESSKTEEAETESVVEEITNTELPANPGELVTESSKTEEAETESVVEEANNTEPPATNNESTDATIETEPTSSEPELNVETSSISSNPSTEATEVTAEPSSNPIEEVPSTTISPCTELGNFANPTNCRRYLSCTGNTTNLISEDCQCPEKTAFNPILGRCTRDLSPCLDEEPVCLRASNIPNPNGEKSSYFWCVPSLLGGFHKYQIQCSENEVFVPLIGRCWITTPQIGGGLGFGFINLVPSDRDIVRAEWKLLRKEIKDKIKAEKQQKKMEEKAKARAEKLAAKELKKQKGAVRKVDDENDGEEEDDE